MMAGMLESLVKGYRRLAPTGRGGYRLARWARRFHPRDSWRSTFTTPDGIRLDLDLGVYPDCCMALGLYELDTARLIKRLLQPGDRFIDVGANLGYFTLLAAKYVGAAGRVDAFEPLPENRARLESHVKTNGLGDRVHVHPLALSDRAGEAVIHRPTEAGRNHGEASLFTSPGAATADTPVMTARLDEVLAATLPGASPRVIKIDVEGAEPLVVAGMAGLLLGERPPAIVMEHNVVALAVAGFSPTEAVGRVLAIQPRYRVHRIGWRVKRIEPTAAVLGAMEQGNLLMSVG